jgi:hypothetical protein
MRDLHNALKTQVLGNAECNGTQFKLVSLRHGRDDVRFSLHAYPNTYTTAGLQRTDTLAYLSFRRSECSYFPTRRCYAAEVSEDFDLASFADAFGSAHDSLVSADKHLSNCGLPLDIREGWGFFHGRASQKRRHDRTAPGDGHRGSDSRVLKESSDDVFKYVLTWLDAPHGKGWVTHVRPLHPPLSDDVGNAMGLLRLNASVECPEFEFESCNWFFRSGGTDDFGSFRLADGAHRAFDHLATHFTPGLRDLVQANAATKPYGFSFWKATTATLTRRVRDHRGTRAQSGGSSRPRRERQVAGALPDQFDVALSFAGADRKIAESIATVVRDAGYSVFYDDFFPEHLWGKDLPAFFHRIYSEQSRYCVILISPEYAAGMWTNHERRSAQQRMLESKGADYILPIVVRPADVPGLQGTIGYLSLAGRTVPEVSEILLRRLSSES